MPPAATTKPFTPHLHKHTCTHTDPAHDHASITSYTLTLTAPTPPRDNPPPSISSTLTLTSPTSAHQIATFTAHLLHLPPSSRTLWSATRAYDAAHAPAAKLHKVENYLCNEGFHARYQDLLEEAQWVLYLERAVVRPERRGRGLGLWGVDAVVEAVEGEVGGGVGVVMLEAGPVALRPGEREAWEVGDFGGREGKGGWEDGGGGGAQGDETGVDATEKIARHWMRMGFAAWSDTGEAWLLLSTRERPAVGDVVALMLKERERVA